jgi:dipeptidyl aminopeptidase/acylaminoacyl peptidase
MVKLLAGLAVLFGTAAMTPVAIIALSAPKSPPPMTFMAVPPSVSNLPEPRTFRARDGVDLQYYAYPAQANRVAVLIHGSVGPGKGLNPLAQSLQAAGITTYVPDVRGHGGSGARGDIEYIGQIDDDLADFVSQLGPTKSEDRIPAFLLAQAHHPSAAVRWSYLIAMSFCRQSCRVRRLCAQTPEAGRIFLCRAS